VITRYATELNSSRQTVSYFKETSLVYNPTTRCDIQLMPF